MGEERQKGKVWKGSYTVETALLMGILLPILFGIIWICFFCYEKAVLQGSISERAFLENMKKEEYNQSEEEVIREESLGKARLSFEVFRMGNQVTVRGEGHTVIPGILSAFFPDGIMVWRIQANNSWADGTKRIRALFQKKAFMERRGSG